MRPSHTERASERIVAALAAGIPMAATFASARISGDGKM
jgi:hypothetical protein